MKHTPVLWGWEYVGGDFAILGPNGELICTVWHGIYPEQREEEYARLIAAAPAMYEALEAFISAEGSADVHGMNHPETQYLLDEALEKAEAALAAARGES